jgi:hypothetical protein
MFMTTITVTIPEPLDQKLQARAAAQGCDIATVALGLIKQGLRDDVAARTARALPHEERLKILQEYLKDRPSIDVVLDDSRESIYEGRGE